MLFAVTGTVSVSDQRSKLQPFQLLIRVNCGKVLDFFVTDQYWIPQ